MHVSNAVSNRMRITQVACSQWQQTSDAKIPQPISRSSNVKGDCANRKRMGNFLLDRHRVQCRIFHHCRDICMYVKTAFSTEQCYKLHSIYGLENLPKATGNYISLEPLVYVDGQSKEDRQLVQCSVSFVVCWQTDWLTSHSTRARYNTICRMLLMYWTPTCKIALCAVLQRWLWPHRLLSACAFHLLAISQSIF